MVQSFKSILQRCDLLALFCRPEVFFYYIIYITNYIHIINNKKKPFLTIFQQRHFLTFQIMLRYHYFCFINNINLEYTTNINCMSKEIILFK